MVTRVTQGLRLHAVFEPGRLIAANAGVLVSRVIYVKHGEAKTFLIMDAGMNDLIRPAMYDAHHEIVPVTEPAPGSAAPPLRRGGAGVRNPRPLRRRPRRCRNSKSGDLGGDPVGRRLWRGDGRRLQCPSAASRKSWSAATQWGIVRPRESDDDLIAKDRIPDWLRTDPLRPARSRLARARRWWSRRCCRGCGRPAGFIGFYLALALTGLFAFIPWPVQALLLAATITAIGPVAGRWLCRFPVAARHRRRSGGWSATAALRIARSRSATTGW